MKKIFSIILTAVLFISAAAITTPSFYALRSGQSLDVKTNASNYENAVYSFNIRPYIGSLNPTDILNSNYSVSSSDILQLQKHVAHLLILDGDEFENADLNNDGVVDLSDVLIGQQVAARLIELPAEQKYTQESFPYDDINYMFSEYDYALLINPDICPEYAALRQDVVAAVKAGSISRGVSYTLADLIGMTLYQADVDVPCLEFLSKELQVIYPTIENTYDKALAQSLIEQSLQVLKNWGDSNFENVLYQTASLVNSYSVKDQNQLTRIYYLALAREYKFSNLPAAAITAHSAAVESGNATPEEINDAYTALYASFNGVTDYSKETLGNLVSTAEQLSVGSNNGSDINDAISFAKATLETYDTTPKARVIDAVCAINAAID